MRSFSFRFAFPLAVLALAVALTGCPNGLLPGSFLSADPFGSGRGTDFVDSPTAGSDDGGAEGEGGGERDVVEPDVIRQTGDTLFVLNQYRGLSIIDLESETLLSQTPTVGYPRDLYVIGDRAYVIVANVVSSVIGGDAIQVTNLGTRLYVVDLASLSAPTVLGTFDLEGDLIDSRLVGDVLYTVGADFSYYYGPEDDGGNEGGGTTGTSPGGGAVKQQTSSSWVSSIDLSNPADVQVVDELSFDGYGNVIQATSSALFVAGHSWETDATTITYVDISDPSGTIAVRGSVGVPGNVPDRFKMDVWNNVLRVVSNTGWPDRQTYVSTVPLADPDALAVLGQTTIPGAENETLFATRFDGPRAYAVTYLVVDPLFVLDLSDPANPSVTGSLEVPGWSTHIEPRGDRLIALGVDDTNGRRVSVSLFDVTDPAAPALLDRESFGEDWAWSSAYSDVKAFTVLDDTLIVPFSGWNEEGGYDRLQFLSYTNDTIDVRGHVDLRSQAVRSFEHLDHYYGVTLEEVAIIDGADLDAPEVVGSITLAENISDFLPLEDNDAAGVAVIRSYTDNRITLKAQEADGAVLSELALDGSYADSIQTDGEVVALASVVWEADKSYTVVQTIDYANPAAPVERTAVRLDVRPVYSWYMYDRSFGGPGMEVDGAAADMIAPYYFNAPSSVIAGDKLVIYGQRENGTKALAVVNLSTGEAAGTADLDYGWVGRLIASGNSVIVHSQEEGGQGLLGQTYTRHYVSAFNPAALTLGPRANVPGEPIAYRNGVLTLDDWQYTTNFAVERVLRTARWNGGDAAELLDSETLGNGFGTLLTGGDFVFMQTYTNSGFGINAYEISAAGDIDTLSPLPATTWNNLLAADDDGTLYAYGDNATLTRYSAPGTWTIRDTTPLNQWPLGVRFSSDTAYIPLGYAGLVTLER
jgi:hypothetical protein